MLVNWYELSDTSPSIQIDESTLYQRQTMPGYATINETTDKSTATVLGSRVE